MYLSHLDLLDLFITHFNESVSQSKLLSKAYQIKFSMSDNLANYSLNHQNGPQQSIRTEFMRAISNTRHSCTDFFVVHKDTHLAVPISKQQAQCLMLLMQGLNAGEIAARLVLSARTVYHYLDTVKLKLGCRNSKELIAKYHTQILG